MASSGWEALLPRLLPAELPALRGPGPQPQPELLPPNMPEPASEEEDMGLGSTPVTWPPTEEEGEELPDTPPAPASEEEEDAAAEMVGSREVEDAGDEEEEPIEEEPVEEMEGDEEEGEEDLEDDDEY